MRGGIQDLKTGAINAKMLPEARYQAMQLRVLMEDGYR